MAGNGVRPPPMWTQEGRQFALSHPARKQVDEPNGRAAVSAVSAGGGEYNIWYGKICHNREHRQDFGKTRTQRETRCEAIGDCGRTRGYEQNSNFCCYHFAKGQCAYGEACTFLHLIPTAEECAKFDRNPERDVFGRDRHAEDKQSRGGVGSFLSVVKTLYIGFGAATERLGNLEKIQQAVEDAFSEWGLIENVYVLRGKNVAFVRYAFRSSAEFAKEAMSNQRLKADSEGAEVLNVRWAMDDPNPTVMRTVKRSREEAYADGLERMDAHLNPEQRAAAALARSIAVGAGEDGQTAAYPGTDHMYAGYGRDTASLTAPRMPAAVAFGLAAAFGGPPGHAAAAAGAGVGAYAPSSTMADYSRHAAHWASVLGIEDDAPTALIASDGHVYTADDPAYVPMANSGEEEDDDDGSDDDDEPPPPPPPKPGAAEPDGPAAVEGGSAVGADAGGGRQKHWDEYTPEEQRQWHAWYYATYGQHAAGATAVTGADGSRGEDMAEAGAATEAPEGMSGGGGPVGGAVAGGDGTAEAQAPPASGGTQALILLIGYGSGDESEEALGNADAGGASLAVTTPALGFAAAAPAPQGGIAAAWRTNPRPAAVADEPHDSDGGASGETLSGDGAADGEEEVTQSGKDGQPGAAAGTKGQDVEEEETPDSFIRIGDDPSPLEDEEDDFIPI